MSIKKALGFVLQTLDTSSLVTPGVDIHYDHGEASEVLDAEINVTIPGIDEFFDVKVFQVRHRPRHKQQLVEPVDPE